LMRTIWALPVCNHHPCGRWLKERLGLVYLTWTTLSFQTGKPMHVRGNRRIQRLASYPFSVRHPYGWRWPVSVILAGDLDGIISTNLRSFPYSGDQQCCWLYLSKRCQGFRRSHVRLDVQTFCECLKI